MTAKELAIACEIAFESVEQLSRTEKLAKARLAEAAPDLLEACNLALKLLPPLEDSREEYRETRAKLIAAISKVQPEGRP